MKWGITGLINKRTDYYCIGYSNSYFPISGQFIIHIWLLTTKYL